MRHELWKIEMTARYVDYVQYLLLHTDVKSSAMLRALNFHSSRFDQIAYKCLLFVKCDLLDVKSVILSLIE